MGDNKSSSSEENDNFITVVTVGSSDNHHQPYSLSQMKTDSTIPSTNSAGYVTVLTIDSCGSDNNNSCILNKNVIEEVLVYRLPGERLGFGLKFEGGTKSNEFVKRLFIQSCAPDSPASRVESSWGNLTEGDEVLEIDCIPVNNMTRIDCVRSLKDSNVVIKLLVRHFYDNINKSSLFIGKTNGLLTTTKTRSIEDLPLVISAEKKRSPPPPPPVPPRKIPRKFYRNINCTTNNKSIDDNNSSDTTNNKITTHNKKFQSPRNSGRLSHSPEIPRRNRKYSDKSLTPQDAQVYTDLFLLDSRQSLSESDDTSSSISTVVDRFNSFPSSIAGSLPSTPTAIQKQLDLSKLLNSYDDEEISSVLKQYNNSNSNEKIILDNNNIKNNNIIANTNIDDNSMMLLQPLSSFQDAPLSYGNEDMQIIESNNQEFEERATIRKPPVPPRLINRGNNDNHDNKLLFQIKTYDHDENMNSLPRLVDFVPKFMSKDISADNSLETIQLFLENERRESKYLSLNKIYNTNSILDMFSKESKLNSSTSFLATIGEVEEEEIQAHRSFTPNKTTKSDLTKKLYIPTDDDDKLIENNITIKDSCTSIMETLPSDSRQPPDGHEFPDYEELPSPLSNPTNIPTTKLIYKNYVTSFSKQLNIPDDQLPSPMKTYKSTECINLCQASFNSTNNKPLSKTNSLSNNDLNQINSSKDDITFGRTEIEVKLHTRSQSLIDMSGFIAAKQKTDRWNLLAEQRRKGLSKLKGLVIPENISENEPVAAVNLPEIVSQTTPTPSLILDYNDKFDALSDTKLVENNNQIVNQVPLPLTAPPWDLAVSGNIPKYSPAFKRKNLHIYSEKCSDVKTNLMIIKNNDKTAVDGKHLIVPKNPETDSNIIKNYDDNKAVFITDVVDLRTCEGESDDNDSAVSSNQSSYVSKYSPTSCDIFDYDEINSNEAQYNNMLNGRLLKPTSVEAINRKNILASAKCRSGQDKVGSPVIHRKCKENEKENSLNMIIEPIANIVVEEQAQEECEILSPSIKSELIIKTDDNLTSKRVVVLDKNNSLEEPTLIPTTPKNNKNTNIVNNNSIKDVIKRDVLKISSRISSSSILQPPKQLSVSSLRKSFEIHETTTPPMPSNNIVTKSYNKKIDNQKTDSRSKILEKSVVNKKVNYESKNTKVQEESTKSKTWTKNQTNPVTNTVPLANNRKTVVLSPKNIGESIGITLAGGTDYETKEILIHRIRYGSVAYENGNLNKGDKVISINGKTTKGLTHAESIEILKEPVSKFVFVIENSANNDESVKLSSPPKRQSKIIDTQKTTDSTQDIPLKNFTHTIDLIKDGGTAGLGFSIEGGKDSLQGDVPLRVKKIFTGGVADKNGKLNVGDELLAINDKSYRNLSKIEAWTLMKKMPDGIVKIYIHR